MTSTTEDKMEAKTIGLAQKIDSIRQGMRPVPSDRHWVRQWTGLGSAKTWAKVLKGDFSELNVEKQFISYQAVLNALEIEADERANEEFYSDLAPAQTVELLALRLLHHRGKDRLMLIEAGSGGGKTTALKLLKNGSLAGMLTIVEADETWKSLRVALGDMLSALGVPEKKISLSTAGRLRELRDTLTRMGRVTLAIDEAHHCTGAVLNCLKTVLNQTEVRIILAGMNTLLRKLRATASEEAKQLIHNRLFARIELSTPDLAGAEMFLARRTGGSGWKKTTLQKVCATSAHAGLWAFIRRVADHINDARLSGESVDDLALLQATTEAHAEIS